MSPRPESVHWTKVLVALLGPVAKGAGAAPERRALADARERNRIPVAAVFADATDFKSGIRQNPLNSVVGELVAVFRVNGLAPREVQIKLRLLDAHVLLSRAFQVHLDA